MGDMTAAHLKTFRYVTWTQIGVGADSAEIFAELKALASNKWAYCRQSVIDSVRSLSIPP